jgi:hypothetical protein
MGARSELCVPEGARGVASRIRGRGSLLRSLRALCRRLERFALHRAATAEEQLWSGRLADRLEAAMTEALESPGARASLAAVDRRATVSRKVPAALSHAGAARSTQSGVPNGSSPALQSFVEVEHG